MAVHGFDQSGYMFWRGILADAVAQIEDVLATGRSRLIGGAKGPQRAQHLGIDDFWRGKQHGRIEIALQRLRSVAIATIKQGASRGQVHRPVHAKHLTGEGAHGGQPLTPALGEDDARHDAAVAACAAQLLQTRAVKAWLKV